VRAESSTARASLDRIHKLVDWLAESRFDGHTTRMLVDEIHFGLDMLKRDLG